MKNVRLGRLIMVMGLGLGSAVQAAQSGWLRVPTQADFDAVYPKEAIAANVKGEAKLDCQGTPDGVLTDCKIVSETPPGYNFGPAALSLAPRYLLQPGGPSRRITLTIGFNTVNRAAEQEAYKNRLTANGFDVDNLMRDLRNDDPTVIDDLRRQGIDPDQMKVALGIAPERRAATSNVRLLSAPAWLAAPSWAQIDAAWPRFAVAAVADVALQCALQPTGELKSCQVVSEKPTSQGFSGAAMTLSKLFKAKLAPLAPGQAFAATQVQIVIHMTKPGTVRPPAPPMGQPALLVEPSPASIDAAFGPALQSSNWRGTVGMRCVVGAQGTVSQCIPAVPLPGQPPALAQAMLSLAPAYRVTAWQQGIGPTEGGSVTLRLNVGAAPAPVRGATAP